MVERISHFQNSPGSLSASCQSSTCPVVMDMEPTLSLLTISLQEKIKAYKIFSKKRKMQNSNERVVQSASYSTSLIGDHGGIFPFSCIYSIYTSRGRTFISLRPNGNGAIDLDPIELSRRPEQNQFFFAPDEQPPMIVVRIRLVVDHEDVDHELMLEQQVGQEDLTLFRTGPFANLFTEIEENFRYSPQVSKQPSLSPSPPPPPQQ